MIYLAPLQGFTDFVYRKSYNEIFNDIDAFFTPYITLKNGVLHQKYVKEVLPENNLQKRVVPQVLVKDSVELISLSERLKNYDYSEINLNLGCPYPMVTNRGKGSGLLPYPEKVREILNDFFLKSDLKLSVKLRAGLETADELEQIIMVLNEFPLTEVILHPRISKQLYAGEIIENAYAFTTQNIKHKLVFNGDVFSVDDYRKRQQQFPLTKKWMLGRGVLMNPFLPSEIKGKHYSKDEKTEMLFQFHKRMLENYLEVMDNEGNALNKMQQFWFYFSYNFTNQRKVFKSIKKSKSMMKFQIETKKIFSQL